MSEAYKSSRGTRAGRAASARGAAAPDAAATRELRAQGRKTMRRLLDAGMRVFADRGFHAARVDDIVRAARTSHGTFYLYFTNKEDLLRALATECGHEMSALADTLGPVGPDDDGLRRAARVPRPLLRDLPALRPGDPGVDGRPRRGPRGVGARRAVVHRHRERARPPACARRARPATTPSVSALMAMLERFAYFLVSRRLDFDADAMLDTVTHIVHRGFFAAPLEPSDRRSAAARLADGSCSLGGTQPAAGTSSSGVRSAR